MSGAFVVCAIKRLWNSSRSGHPTHSSLFLPSFSFSLSLYPQSPLPIEHRIFCFTICNSTKHNMTKLRKSILFMTIFVWSLHKLIWWYVIAHLILPVIIHWYVRDRYLLIHRDLFWYFAILSIRGVLWFL